MSSSSSTAAAAPAPLPPQLEALLASVDSSLDAVEAALDPYLAGPLKHLVTALQPIDNARLNTSLAFCSAGLLYSFLRVGGVNPRAPGGAGSEPHAVMEEVDAVKRLFGRVDEAAKTAARNAAAAAGAPRTGTSALNAVVAGRFIRAGLAGQGGSGAGAGGGGGNDSSDDDEGGGSGSSSSAAAAAAAAPPLGGARVASGPGRPAGGPSGFNRKRGRDGGDAEGDGAGAAAAKKGAGSKAEGGHRSTPQPALAHLGWKEEMAKRFKK